MSADTPEIAAARIAVERRKAELMSTARVLQTRLSPGTIAHNAWEGAKIKGADLAEDAVDAVRSRPALAGGVVAALALFLAREPLLDLAAKLTDDVKTKTKSRRERGAAKKKRKTENENA